MAQRFDPLFADAFFKSVSIKSDVQLAFEIPENKTTLANFFKKKGQQYKDGVKGLIDELKTLAKQQHILDEQAETALSIFIKKFDCPQDATEFYTATVFPLYTQGIIKLADIISILKHDTDWSDTQKTLIQHMMHHMGMCAPASYSTIVDTWLALSSDFLTEMMSIRRVLAQQVAVSILNQFDKRLLLGGDEEIEEGTDDHYIKGLLNLHHEKLGINFIEDEHTKKYAPKPGMSEAFIALVETDLKATSVIDEILQRHQKQWQKAAPDTTFIQWLDRYGTDSQFNLDQIADIDDDFKYYFKKNVEYYLMQTLLTRLTNSGLFNKKKMHEHTVSAFPSTTLHLPVKDNIKLAFVETAKTSEPFVLFYLRQFYEEAKTNTVLTQPLEALCTSSQQTELLDEIKKLIRADWPHHVATLSSTELENIIIFFNKKFPADKRLLLWMQNVISLHTSVVDVLSASGRLNVDNTRQMLDLLLNLENDDDCSTALLLGLFDVLRDNKESLQQLIDDLLAAQNHAKHLAKAIYLAFAANIIDDNVVQFFKAHLENADDVAKILILFNHDLKVDIDTSLLTFLDANKDRVHEFAACLNNKETHRWINYLIEQNVLDVDRIKQLFKYAKHINLIINTFADLCSLNPELLSNIDKIISCADRVALLNFIRNISSHCINRKITFDKRWFENMMNYEGEYPPFVDDTTLAFYAAMLGMTELLESMIMTGTIDVKEFSPSGSGATLLIIATLYGFSATVNMLVEKGANLDDAITLKVYVLESAIPDSGQSILMRFLRGKLSVEQPDVDSDVVVTANELAGLMQQIVKNPSGEHTQTHGVFAQIKTASAAELDNPDNKLSLDK